MDCKDVLRGIRAHSSQKNKEGMARFGINTERAHGVSVYVLRDMAKGIGKNHGLAQELWESGVHEARILATIVDEPDRVTEDQMGKWVRDFDSWDVCDLCCSNLFDKTGFAYGKAFEWSSMEGEFVKRAGFVMMAALSVHDKKAGNWKFEQFFPVIKREARDERNFVRKAVNWALRNIGKRNRTLNRKAIRVAEEIKRTDSKAARWIASDALRELRSEKVQRRLRGQ